MFYLSNNIFLLKKLAKTSKYQFIHVRVYKCNTNDKSKKIIQNFNLFMKNKNIYLLVWKYWIFASTTVFLLLINLKHLFVNKCDADYVYLSNYIIISRNISSSLIVHGIFVHDYFFYYTFYFKRISRLNKHYIRTLFESILLYFFTC